MSLKLDVLADMLEVIQECFPEDASVSLFDTEKLLAQTGKGKFKDKLLEIGTPLEKLNKTVTYKSLQAKQTLKEEKGPGIFDFAYIGIATPIFDEDEVIGALTVLTSAEKTEKLKQHSDRLQGVVDQTSTLFEEVSTGNHQTNDMLQSLAQESEAFAHSMKDIYSVLTIIKEVSSRTNLLGLNAAIEATRAGEHGSGFAVVASEVRRLADSSKESVEEVHQQLGQIQQKIHDMNHSVQQIASSLNQHTNSLEEFHSVFKVLSEISTDLHQQARV